MLEAATGVDDALSLEAIYLIDADSQISRVRRRSVTLAVRTRAGPLSIVGTGLRSRERVTAGEATGPRQSDRQPPVTSAAPRPARC